MKTELESTKTELASTKQELASNNERFRSLEAIVKMMNAHLPQMEVQETNPPRNEPSNLEGNKSDQGDGNKSSEYLDMEDLD